MTPPSPHHPPAGEAPDLPATVTRRYRPVRVLGKGGMGTVYEVEHVHTGQRLALKALTLRQGMSLERFQREMRIASRICSDHVVRVTDGDGSPESGGTPYFVMELLDGADLETATYGRPASPADVVDWLRQVARGLTQAHALGIVHRDLKPANLFMTRRPDGSKLVKILDFGIAQAAADGQGLADADVLLGTPDYMAPEQTDGGGPPVRARADLYALGLIAFRLLTGRNYRNAESLAQVFVQILADPTPPPSARGSVHGAAFDAWFLRACHRDPDRRFTSAEEQIEALAAALGASEEQPASGVTARRAEPLRRTFGTTDALEPPDDGQPPPFPRLRDAARP